VSGFQACPSRKITYLLAALPRTLCLLHLKKTLNNWLKGLTTTVMPFFCAIKLLAGA
jgi:hypothetical protein